MATKREKLMLGALFLAAAGAAVFYLAMPQAGQLTQQFEKIASIEASLIAKDSRIEFLEKKIINLKKLKELPDNITVRQFEPDTFQQKVKSMLDSIVNLSTLNGNDLIALSPWQAPGIPVPPPKLDKEGNPIPEEHPKPKLETFGYELVVRGDYRSIIGFIASLNDHGELIEITDVKLENEAGENRSTTTSEALNPFKPIKLTTRLVLFLQPKL